MVADLANTLAKCLIACYAKLPWNAYATDGAVASTAYCVAISFNTDNNKCKMGHTKYPTKDGTVNETNTKCYWRLSAGLLKLYNVLYVAWVDADTNGKKKAYDDKVVTWKGK